MIGRSISHYRILEKLGEGGMGVVYKAEDTRLHRTVAIKFLSRSLLQLGLAEKERFYTEARAASRLEHPSIETIYEIDEQDGDVFIVMGYIEGETLRKRIGATPSGLPVSEVVALAVQIAEGLHAAHERDIIHRDIKSDNIMVTPKGQIKIMDFGLAKLKGGSALTKTGSTVGTIGFMAPEQIRHEEVDQRADIWSFGVVLFEMLTGQLPFRGDHEAAIIYSILNEQPKLLRDLRPDIPPELARIVTKALEKKRDSRYGSMTEILGELTTFRSTLEGHTGGGPGHRSIVQSLARPLVGIPVVLSLIAASVLAYHLVDRSEHVRWALEQALPRLAKLVDDHRYAEAYTLAADAEKYIGNDSTFTHLMLQCSFVYTVRTIPAGASVSIKPYAASDSAWRSLGVSPLEGYRLGREPSRLRIEKPGFHPIEMILAPFWDGGSFPAHDTLMRKLDPTGSIPETMVRVSGGESEVYLVGLEQVKPVVLGDYLMDKYEVTNREYKEFVDAGGYTNQQYWKVPFLRSGREIPWAEAVTLFRDATGRPGPATWEMGTYTEGHADYPVSGVSWYEAAAYAQFAGKSLPTLYQWNRAAGTPRSALIVPLSNFGSQGIAPVGSYKGLGSFGTFDMAGNVKEWIWNEAGLGRRYIPGGAWNEPRYMFNDPDAQLPLERNTTFGFRCVKQITDDPDPVRSHAPVVIPMRDFSKERPVPDNIFSVFRTLYSYDRKELQSVVESRDTSEEYWTREKITFNAAYGNERVVAYLFLPKRMSPPYQTVVYFPGSNAIHQRTPFPLETGRIDLIIKSGRAVMYPVYKSTYERGDGLSTDVPDSTVSYRDHVIMWVKDCSRSVDYLETRSDLNVNKLGFLGVSWGAVIGNFIPAIDQRFKAAVLLAGGLSFQRALPEAEQLNFVPHIKAPTLMMNGRYDFFFPVETCQLGLFKLLKMPESQKRKVVFDTGHSVPRVEAGREILDWLDKYLGPVGK